METEKKLKWELAQLRARRRQLERIVRDAFRDLRLQGPQITTKVADSHGAVREKVTANPSFRIIRESEALIKILGQKTAAIEAALKEVTAPAKPDGWAEFSQ